MNVVSRVLVWCAGASPNMVSKCPAHERLRYEGIGMTVVMTGVFAGISGGYAINRIMHSMNAAVWLGILWGFMIFNIDRMFVSGFRRRRGEKIYVPLGRALPRGVLAIAIALVISKPLEIRVTGERLNEPLLKLRNRGFEATRSGLENAYDMPGITSRAAQARNKIGLLQASKDAPPTTETYTRLKNDYDQCDKDAKSLQQKNNARIDDISSELRPLTAARAEVQSKITDLNRLPVESSIVTTLRDAENERSRLDALIRDLRDERKSLNAAIGQKQQECRSINDQVVGETKQHREEIERQIVTWSTEWNHLEEARKNSSATINQVSVNDSGKLTEAFEGNLVAELEALALLEDENPTVKTIGRLLWFIFALLECAPILVKFMTPSGPYDAALDAADRHFYSTTAPWNQ